MNNRFEIHSDSTNIFISIAVRSKLIGIVLLSFMIFVVLAAFILIISMLELRGKDYIPFFTLLSLYLFFGLKYLLWNIFGIENLIINTKSISYYYDYGFFRSRTKTIIFYSLGTEISLFKNEEGEEMGSIHFYNFNQESNLPELIHKSTVLLTEEQLKEIEERLYNLFENEYFENIGFKGFSLN